MAEEPTTYTDEQLGLHLRPVFMEDLEVENEETGETDTRDLYIWFAAATESPDSWFAFGLSDEGDIPEQMIMESDVDSLRRLSVWMGYDWKTVVEGCPHCVAEYQRDRVEETPQQLIRDLYSMDIERLIELRALGEFKAHALEFEAISGQKISLN